MLSHPAWAWLSLAINFPGRGGCAGYVKWLCRLCGGGGVAGLTENKAKPSSWGLAELGNTIIQTIKELIEMESYIFLFRK